MLIIGYCHEDNMVVNGRCLELEMLMLEDVNNGWCIYWDEIKQYVNVVLGYNLDSVNVGVVDG